MKIIYSDHAIDRIFEGDISKTGVTHVLNKGEVIENYPKDKPFPSKLILGWYNNKPIHIVVGEDSKKEVLYIITAYVPDLKKWEQGFKARKGGNHEKH